MHVPGVVLPVPTDRDPRREVGRRRRLLQCDPDQPRDPPRLVAVREEELTRAGIRVRLRLVDVGIAECPLPVLRPPQHCRADAAAPMRRSNVRLGPPPIDLGPGDQLVAVEHEHRVELRIESVPLEADVAFVHFRDAVLLQLARGDEFDDGGDVLGRGGTSGETRRQFEAHGVVHPRQRSGSTGPGSVPSLLERLCARRRTSPTAGTARRPARRSARAHPSRTRCPSTGRRTGPTGPRRRTRSRRGAPGAAARQASCRCRSRCTRGDRSGGAAPPASTSTSSFVTTRRCPSPARSRIGRM